MLGLELSSLAYMVMKYQYQCIRYVVTFLINHVDYCIFDAAGIHLALALHN